MSKRVFAQCGSRAGLVVSLKKNREEGCNGSQVPTCADHRERKG